ncbi:MAG: hypothetical protein M1570_11095 [Chloroflexi bacterium]|nr:hypothetical protein [Chloroflexota bacterium]
MNQVAELRQKCLKTVRELEQAERKASQTHDAAKHLRDSALADARLKNSQVEQQVDGLIAEISKRAEEGDAILADLQIAPSPPTPFKLTPGIGSSELMRLLANQRSISVQAFANLGTRSNELKAERRKWWKFW